MKIGTVKEIKNHEYRVGLTPAGAHALTAAGHDVYVESGAGTGSGFEDAEYEAAGATIVKNAKDVWGGVDMIYKVKEPVEAEYGYFREGLILYTYLHLASEKHLTEELLKNKVKAVAFETITDQKGALPCLTPMSIIAGRLSVIEGAKYCEKSFGGQGILLPGVPGVEKHHVVILGGGIVGTNACKIAVGLGAQVTVIDISADRLAYLDDLFDMRVTTLFSTPANIQKALKDADLVIGAVLIPGSAAPKLIKKEYLREMKPGAVLVDVAIDQGGSAESSHPTTHDDPIFIEDGVVHYCVTNMPGAVARTSTISLANATLPYALLIADHGLEAALAKDAGLLNGLNCYDGMCTYEGVAKALDLEYRPYLA
ncbi:MAG: alanine dehydrogenase [Lachnospiraceae bacterium]|nr:alanine dehydrogenase [Lachnospiraceae bacterium]